MKDGNTVLSCCNVSACYGTVHAHQVLRNVTIEVMEAEIVGLLGPNGFGKSSLLNAIAGLLRVVEGEIRFQGRLVSDLSPEKISRSGIRLFPQGGHVFNDLTVDENLRVAESCVPRECGSDRREAYEWFPDMESRAETRAGLLSGGQRQMLSLAMVFLYMHAPGPVAFLLDEPSGSLDPSHRNRLAEVLANARRRHKLVILIAEENAVFAKSVCDRYYQFTEPGRIVPL